MTDVLTRPQTAAPPRMPHHYPAWTVVGTIVAIALVAFGGLDIAGLLSHEPVHHRHAWAGPVHQVDVSTSNGSVTLVGSDRSGAVVVANGAMGLTRPSDDETLTHGVLHIHSSCPGDVIGSNWCSLSYRVEVPRGATVTASSVDGSVQATGMDASLALSSNDGAVAVTGARSQAITASSSDGSVNLGFAAAPTSVSAHSNDGSVVVSVPKGAATYQVDAHSNDGKVTINVPTVPAGPRRIVATSNDGHVTVGYRSG